MKPFWILAISIVLVGSQAQAASPGDVVINEIMQNPSAVADSAGEWFELFNHTDSDININGWTIEDNDIDSHVINNGGPLIIPAGGFLVLGNNDDSATNGGVTVAYQYPSNFYLSNSADELVLRDGSLTEIDRVEYDGGLAFPDPTGASMALIDPDLDNNVGANWCESSTPFGDGDLGTPGAANDCVSCIEDLTARPKSGKVQLVWTDTGAASYNVYRSTTMGGPYTLIANTTSTFSTYLDTNVTNGVTYYYVVREVALNTDELCQSNEVNATSQARTRTR